MTACVQVRGMCACLVLSSCNLSISWHVSFVDTVCLSLQKIIFVATHSGTSPGTTCDALSGIATSQRACSTNPACDEIDCSVQGYTAAMALLPCNSPLAIRLTVNDSSGVTLYSQTLSQSRQVPLLGGAVTLLVTVDQLDGALGVQVSVPPSIQKKKEKWRLTPCDMLILTVNIAA